MSAAEKLKALDEAILGMTWRVGQTPGYLSSLQEQHVASGHANSPPLTLRSDAHTEEIATFWNYLLDTKANANGIAALRNALPQIVAVVEAAEAVESQCVAPALYKELTALLDALAALDEALGDDELRDEGIHDAFDANQWD